jgi:trans-2,3-dihydro-3-hydroxyanthranilate isomerase
MHTYPYQIVNVFTRGEDRFSGNPLAVYYDITANQSLTDAQMQAIARQMNLSETTFVLPSSSSSVGAANCRVRIFTPSYEMPFAGHPTLGTAQVMGVLLAKKQLVFEMIAGLIPASQTNDSTRWTFTARPATQRAVTQSAAELAAALSLEPNDVLETATHKPMWMKAGKEQLIIPLASVEAVKRAQANAAAFRTIRSEDNNAMALVFAPVSDQQVLARFFFEQGSAMLEDPATGSACANLAAWYQALGHAKAGEAFARTVSQGEQVKRPSTLYLSVTAEGALQVGGEVISLGRGTIEC